MAIPIKRMNHEKRYESLKSFASIVHDSGKELKRTQIDIVQINVGYVCNLTCRHCHVEAGPDRTERMDAKTAQACLAFVKNQKPLRWI